MRRIVVKVGTNTLASPDGRPDPAVLGALAAQMADLMAEGIHVVLVSSGAIGAGRAELGIQEHPADIVERQALAAAGQHHLIQAWDDAFAPHDRRVAQVLLTYHTFGRRRSYLNLRNCLERLLAHGVVPVLNENDTVSIDEIDASFGDNDRLAALVAAKLEADLLVLLSDVGGLYDRPPGEPGARRLPLVEVIDDAVLALAAPAKAGGRGRGGMTSKLQSAKMATEMGVPVVLADGRQPDVVAAAAHGDDVGTRFLPAGHRSGRERWLLIAPSQGTIHIDAGAAAALAAGRHLLPAGVTGVDGDFDVASVVALHHDGRDVARALTELSSADLRLVMGHSSQDARARLGVEGTVNVTSKGRLARLGSGSD
ncbi:MAG: glutamate 5-kinase [Thermoplasmatota archaeon]